MKLSAFSQWLRALLRPELFKDYCPNGLCVEGGAEVQRVLTGVSFRMELVEEAIRTGANCLVVHHPHGFWSNEPRLPIGALGRKIQLLLRHGISLYGFHLPLDGHAELGNNVLIARGMGLNVEGTFAREGMADIGVVAATMEPLTPAALQARFSALLGYPVQHALLYGAPAIERVAICSGGGVSGLAEAASLGVQAFLTGEIKEATPIWASEEHMHVLAGGHHRTEVFGVRALAAHIERELRIPASFYDIDNAV
jgi:dinuclear metal center YbgI/SA1388 family protein